MENFINNGNPTMIWNGVTESLLRKRCEFATEQEAAAMSYVSALMMAEEAISSAEWSAAYAALNAVESRLVNSFVGPIRLNRFGRYFGGAHPALF